MTFLDSKPINIRKYVYKKMNNGWEFLHTFLSIEGAREYVNDHGRQFGGGEYQIREVETVIEDIVV